MMAYFLTKGGLVRCFRMAARYAPDAFAEIEVALAEAAFQIPHPPVSCAARLADKMGMSEKHQVIAAGLAGGIGLSGAGCGALGTALWITGLRYNRDAGGKIDYQDPKGQAVIDRFAQCTQSEFTCAKIVGRRFESVEDHAGYLRGGGCAEMIETLAAPVA